MIISAACKAVVNGEENIFPVMRHCDFFNWMKMLHCEYDKNSVEQGFIAWDPTTREEIFLDRVKAYEHARDCGQIPWTKNITALYSEDLY